MHNHLTIKANGKPLSLPPEDFSLDIDFENPMFNEEDSFSYPVEIPLEGNRHLVKNVEDKKSPLRPVSLENIDTKIFVEGFPFFEGQLKTQDDEEVTDTIAFNIDGGCTLSDLITDLDCVDIPLKDKICIGEKIGQVDITVSAIAEGRLEFSEKIPGLHAEAFNTRQDVEMTASFTPQALGFSVPKTCRGDITENANVSETVTTDASDGYEYIIPKIEESEGGQSYINVSEPYPAKQYCNARVAYKHYAKSDDETTSDSVDSPAYYVLDADRPQSGICFYVQYFLDCLFDYLGLEWDNSALSAIEDFNRLCFFTTKCKYEEEVVNQKYEVGDSITLDIVNDWLKSRGCGAQLELNCSYERDTWNSMSVKKGTVYGIGNLQGEFLQDYTFVTDTDVEVKLHPTRYVGTELDDFVFTAHLEKIYGFWLEENKKIKSVNVQFDKMYATNENFPDMTVSDVISSLENQFGIRFLYQPEKKKVTAVLLRDVFRNNDAPRQFLGTIHEMNKVAEKITGVRVCYSNESDSKDQTNNLRDSTKDYDTSYDYIDYPSPDTKKAIGQVSACTTVIDKTFSQICNKATNTDNTCYIDQTTGNAYRIKVDSEAEDANSLKPAWFEVGQFKGVEIGDCSTENEDFVQEFSSDFEPLVLSDVNSRAVCAAVGTSLANKPSYQPMLCPFCDEDMEHEFIKQYLDYPFDTTIGSPTIRASLRLIESYDVSSSDDGNSPLQSYDWGNAIAIMRGGGSDASLQKYDANYDGFGSSKWRTVAGTYALTIDSIDHLGNHYDYNGTEEGLARGERFSLKIRAYKQPEWADAPLCDPDEHSDTDGWYYIRHRGTFDRFMSEYADFILNRRKFIVRCECTPAFLADIPNHWCERWRINDEVGYINKVSASISCDTGLDEVEIEFYAM